MELVRNGELKWMPKLSQLLTNQQQLNKNSTRPEQTSHLVQHVKSRTICFDMEIKFELKIRKRRIMYASGQHDLAAKTHQMKQQKVRDSMKISLLKHISLRPKWKMSM